MGYGNAHQHPDERKYDLCVGIGGYLAITDRRDSLSGPVERPNVLVTGCAVSEAQARDPRVLVEVVELGCEEPEAGKHVR